MIPLCIPNIRGNEWKYIKECLDTNWVSSAGNYVDLFEDKFREYQGVKSAVVTVNGTSAIHLALKCLKIGSGDEVIVPSMTFISPVNAIRYTGAEPVFVDVCRDTYVLDANKVEELISPRTKAILPVHIYGHPADMDKIMEIAHKYGLYVVEDATEALGSLFKEKPTGTIGHIGCFSFNGNKLITTGAGGMLITNDDEIGKSAKYISNQAKTVNENGSFYHDEIGYNYRMPNLLAAMGVAQLENIREYADTKRVNAGHYSELLQEASGITLPVEKIWAKNVYWLYSVIIENEFGKTRDELIYKLKQHGIESRPFFIPVHEMKMYTDCRHGDLSITKEISEKGINLPSSTSLTLNEIKQICNIIME